jgi:hypothetical protein
VPDARHHAVRARIVQGFDHGASDKSGSPGDENSWPIHFILPLKINRIKLV